LFRDIVRTVNPATIPITTRIKMSDFFDMLA